MEDSFETNYPNISDWVDSHGWITIGADETSKSFFRVFDDSGLVWEGDDSYPTIDEAMQALEENLADLIDS